jgi:hypothetical protein
MAVYDAKYVNGGLNAEQRRQGRRKGLTFSPPLHLGYGVCKPLVLARL